MSTELSDKPSKKPPQLTSNDSSPTEHQSSSVDPALVQIHASTSQIERRIEAFMQRKQIQVDNANRQLFCGSHQHDEDCSCARVDAMYGLARINGSSHIKVSRIINCHGPRFHPYTSPVKTGVSSQHSNNKPHDVQERLTNMEAHLKIMPDTVTAGQVPLHIYKRLKVLEERILEMESFSPEYMQFLPPPNSERKRAGFLTVGNSWEQKGTAGESWGQKGTERDSTSKYQNMCLPEIDKRIHSLREKLQKKKTT